MGAKREPKWVTARVRHYGYTGDKKTKYTHNKSIVFSWKKRLATEVTLIIVLLSKADWIVRLQFTVRLKLGYTDVPVAQSFLAALRNKKRIIVSSQIEMRPEYSWKTSTQSRKMCKI